VYVVFPRAGLRVHLLAFPAIAMLFWLEGALPASLLLLAAVLHECGHLIALRVFDIPVRRVDVMPMGAVIAYDDSFCPHGQSAWVAFAGAGANLLTAAVCLPFANDLHMLFFVTVNASLAVLNLLPIETLDGGTLLRSVLLNLRTVPDAGQVCRIASRISLLLLAAFFVVIGVHSAFPLWHLLLSAVMLVQIFR